MENLIEVVSGFILGLAVLAPFILKFKSISKEVGELLVQIGVALDDKKITKDEIKSIVAEAKDVLGVFGKK